LNEEDLFADICAKYYERNYFCKKHPSSAVPCKRKIYRIVENFHTASMLMKQNKIQNVYVLGEDKS
jgi:hypothetical protein